MKQYSLTVLVPIKRDDDQRSLNKLEELLDAIGTNVEGNKILRFRDSPSTHFARFVILNHHRTRGPRLMFSSHHDGDLETYSGELASQLGSGLDVVFGYCDHYRSGMANDAAALYEFLLNHAVQKRVLYQSRRDVSVAEIHESQRVREQLTAELEESMRQNLPPRLAKLVPPGPPPPATQSNAFRLAVAAIILRLMERLAGIRFVLPKRSQRAKSPQCLIDLEDLIVQNQMTVVSPVKLGLWPRIHVKLACLIVNLRAKRAQGNLSGITTIHFAYWALIDDDDYLLFESNYDGSWDNYIDDFVDFTSMGMNSIWGTAVDFPRAGCEDVEAFKQIIRYYQVPTQVFYSAYPQSSVKNILNDLELAQATAADQPSESVRKFLTGSYNNIG